MENEKSNIIESTTEIIFESCWILAVPLMVVVVVMVVVVGLQTSKVSGTGIATWPLLANCNFPTCFHWQLVIWSPGQSNWRTSVLSL